MENPHKLLACRLATRRGVTTAKSTQWRLPFSSATHPVDLRPVSWTFPPESNVRARSTMLAETVRAPSAPAFEIRTFAWAS